MKNIMVLLLLLLSQLHIASADMNWRNMSIVSSATEQTTAMRLLQRELYSLQYDDTKTIGDIIRTHSDLQEKFSAYIREYRQMTQNYLTDGSTQYQYELPITSKILSLLTPEKTPVKFVVPMLCPCCGQEWPEGREVPEGIELQPKQIENVEYSGIIIDCRGLNITPCLFPVVYDETGNRVFSADFAENRYIINDGLVLYTTEMSMSSTRVGNVPLQVQALGTKGAHNTDIIISLLDAQRVHGSPHNVNLLKECRVAVIVGL